MRHYAAQWMMHLWPWTGVHYIAIHVNNVAVQPHVDLSFVLILQLISLRERRFSCRNAIERREFLDNSNGTVRRSRCDFITSQNNEKFPLCLFRCIAHIIHCGIVHRNITFYHWFSFLFNLFIKFPGKTKSTHDYSTYTVWVFCVVAPERPTDDEWRAFLPCSCCRVKLKKKNSVKCRNEKRVNKLFLKLAARFRRIWGRFRSYFQCILFISSLF